MKLKIPSIGLFLGLLGALLWVPTSHAQRVMENLNRGLIAVKTGSDVYLSWRLFGTEPSDLGFNLYQGTTKLNATAITATTTYLHQGGASTGSIGKDAYTVRPVVNGEEGTVSEMARVLNQPYLSVPLQIPSSIYSANDASVGDLDGDGEYEIILKWDPSTSKDNSQEGVTDVVYLDAYRLDGKRLWRINLGKNIRAGAHYTQFMVYDFDGDGKAEIMCRTSDGTVDGAGKVIGNASADYRISNGYIMSGAEYLTVFDGMTGKELHTTNYLPERGDPCAWGDPNCKTYANRVDRFLAGVAYLDGQHPSAIFCRGYYTRSVLVAWDWDGSKLTRRWTFDSKSSGNSSYEDQGNHQLSIADVDDDGRDEIIYGAMAVDEYGKGLWNTGLGHGDALHVGDFDPKRPGLEVWGIHEGGKQPGADFRSAKTGEIYWKLPNEDVGRGVAADISADNPGAEMWGPSGGTRDVNGKAITVKTSSTNFLAYWDGDLLRELVDANLITKADGTKLLEATGCSSNNGTKSTPNLSADILGDWREEVMWRTSDSKELRIFTTTIPTNYRLYTLMHNPQYRLSIAWQNVAYNQPPHVDYFLGKDMVLPPPKPKIVLGKASVGLGNHGDPKRLKPASTFSIGHMVRHQGAKVIQLPIGYTDPQKRITVRDIFGNVLVVGRPHNNLLNCEIWIPEGIYFLQVR